MGNGVSTDQGNLPSYGIRDVTDAVDQKQHDWSQLAEAPIIEQPSIALWTVVTAKPLHLLYYYDYCHQVIIIIHSYYLFCRVDHMIRGKAVYLFCRKYSCH